VGGFIGSPAMNFFDADLDGTSETVFLQAGDVRIDLPAEKSQLLAGYRGKQVVVGIRPEDLKPAPDHNEGQTIRGIVEVVEPIGNETYVDLNAGNFSLIAAVGRKSRIKPHSGLVIHPVIGNLHLFDTDSENAIL